MSDRPAGPLAADASLHLLADHLADGLESGDLEPALVHVAGIDGDGFDLGVKPLDGDHPTSHLLGFTAPDDWHAVGLLTHGWAYHLRDREVPPAARPRTRVHVVALLSRTGEVAHRTRFAGDEVLSRSLDGEDPMGEQIDLLRRVLGLETAPPPADASVYWAIDWLATLLDAEPRDLRHWHEATAAHPAMRLLEHDGVPDDADFSDVVTAFHRVCTWPRLRQLTAIGSFRVPELGADDAAWLDDGAFARFVLNRCPSLAGLRQLVADRLPAIVGHQVLATLDELGVPAAAWPDDRAA